MNFTLFPTLKVWLGFLFVSACFFVLSGCGTSEQVQDTASVQQTELTDLRNQMPETRADLNGTVKKIVGNIVTLEVVDMPSTMEDGTTMEEMREKMLSLSEDERMALIEERKKMRESAPTREEEVMIPVGIPITITAWWARMGQGMGRGAGMWRWGMWGPGQGWLAGTLDSSTDTKDTVAPEMGTVSDIREDNTLSIWLSETDDGRKIATWVRVQQ